MIWDLGLAIKLNPHFYDMDVRPKMMVNDKLSSMPFLLDYVQNGSEGHLTPDESLWGHVDQT
jgi:hypothetical protein